MPEFNEGTVAPNSEAAQAIAELQKEGHVIGDHQPIDDEGHVSSDPVVETEPSQPKPDAKVEEPKADEEVPAEVTPKKEDTPERTPRMTEAWKLKVAEDQKEAALKEVERLSLELQKRSETPSGIKSSDTENLVDDIKVIAEESGVDPEFLTKFASTIIAKAQKGAVPSTEIQKALEVVNQLKENQERIAQDTLYSQEFEKDIIPLVKEKYQLSDDQLSTLKSKLKDLAFSEQYAKVPLSKLFKAEEDTFGLQEPKRSSEGRGPKVRASEVIDYDNLTEDQFKNMTPDQVLEFEKKQSGSWSRR